MIRRTIGVLLDGEMVMSRNQSMKNILLKELIKQAAIDTDYYYVTMEEVGHVEDCSDRYAKLYYVTFTLERQGCWDSLEECEERLKVGL